jgi:thiamine biosynthesis lipoprotein
VWWLLRLTVSIAALVSPAPSRLHRFEAVEPHMGTLVRVTVYTRDETGARSAFRAAFDRIRHLDDVLSDYRPDSELNQLTKTAIGRTVPVSRDLFRVLAASQDLAAATDGAFDITQGPVIRLWREARKNGRVPEPAALQEAASRSGFRRLHLDPARRTATVDTAGMALDVGGIGKGFAASEALAAIEKLGVRSALVAVSGDLAFSDPPPGERGWRVRVSSATPAPEGVPEVLELSNAAVSTSGNSEQHLDAGGRRYSHIIDPASGLGLVDDIAVTVVAGHGLDADGLDTAVSVIGAARGLALIESRRDASALIVERTSAGTRVLQSSGFQDLVRRHGPRPQR